MEYATIIFSIQFEDKEDMENFAERVKEEIGHECEFCRWCGRVLLRNEESDRKVYPVIEEMLSTMSSGVVYRRNDEEYMQEKYEKFVISKGKIKAAPESESIPARKLYMWLEVDQPEEK